jgi:hypothetical protein
MHKKLNIIGALILAGWGLLLGAGCGAEVTPTPLLPTAAPPTATAPPGDCPTPSAEPRPFPAFPNQENLQIVDVDGMNATPPQYLDEGGGAFLTQVVTYTANVSTQAVWGFYDASLANSGWVPYERGGPPAPESRYYQWVPSASGCAPTPAPGAPTPTIGSGEQVSLAKLTVRVNPGGGALVEIRSGFIPGR